MDDPIQVDATPTAAQVAAGIRQIILVVAGVAGALGFSEVAGKASALLAVSGTIAGAVVFFWGQWKTHETAKKAAIMAQHVPDSVAQIR